MSDGARQQRECGCRSRRHPVGLTTYGAKDPDIGEAADDADHQLDPNELLRVAMARQ